MTFLATTEREQRQSLQIGSMGPGTFEVGGPAAFEGFGTATALGAGRAGATVGGLIYELGKKTPGYMLQREIADLFGKGEQFDTMEAMGDQAIRDAIDYYRPDPATTGWAGQISYGVGSTLLPAIGGTLIAGPAGGALLAGGAVGTGTFYDMTGEGVDRRTALGAAGIDAATTAVGVFMPASLGANLAIKAGSGALLNAGLGMGQRYAMGEYMRSAGYGDIAARYDAFDATAVATDVILGAAFGMLPSGRSAEVPQSAVDAAMVQQQVRHAELDTAPGIPASTAALNAHVRATDQATAQLLSGRPVDVSGVVRDAEFVARPDMPVETAAIVQALDDLGYSQIVGDIRELEAELQGRGITVADEALPAVPERAPEPRVEQRASGKAPPAVRGEVAPLDQGVGEIIAERPDMELPAGIVEQVTPDARTAADALAAADEAVNRATIDSAAYQAAVNCFLRNG